MKFVNFENLLRRKKIYSMPKVSRNLIISFCFFFIFILIFSIQFSMSADICAKKLDIYKNMGIGPCMDVAIEGNHAYIIGNGKLYVANISKPDSPLVEGTISRLGNVRQVAVRNGIAYVTSRENGVFIIDVREPSHPVLLCHYDSVEVATGIGISGKIMFIANRTYGVEIVDVSDPENPEFLSIVRTGEAQSVDIKDGYLYTGVHGSKLLVTTDVRNPYKPKITSRVKLDGQGDGIYVQGKYLFISTGNRSRTTPNRKPGDPGYGTGHGLEIYELSDPAYPKFVSRVKFDKIYTYPDLWNVEVSGNYAFCSDTVNGMYIVDIKDIKKPKVISHFPISHLWKGKRKYFSGGLAVLDDYIYVAGGCSDLHIIAARGIAKKQNRPYDNSIKIGSRNPIEKPKNYHLLTPSGQVWAVDVCHDIGVAACGMSGWCYFTLGLKPKIIGSYRTNGFAHGIAVRDGYVFIATDKGNVGIWKYKGKGVFDKKSSCKVSKGQPVMKLVIPPGSKYALLQIGMSTLEIIDISNPEKPVEVMKYKSSGYINGIIGNNLLNNRFAYAAWHKKGLVWFDLNAVSPLPVGTLSGDGIKGACAMNDKLVLFTYSGYKIVSRNDKDIKLIKEKRVESTSAIGNPVVYGKYIITSNREEGKVTILDMSDLENARVVRLISTTANPGPVKIYKKMLIVPDGYGGIRIYNNFLNP